MHCPYCYKSFLPSNDLIYGNVAIEDQGRLRLNGHIVTLPPGLFTVASALIRAQGRVLYRNHLARLIAPNIDPISVVSYIRRIKQAFRQVEPSFCQIRALRGISAYRWELVPGSEKAAAAGKAATRDHHCPSCGYQLLPFEPIELGNVAIPAKNLVLFSGRRVHLAPTQFLLADALIRARGKTVCRSALANLIGPELDDRAVKSYVLRLRRRFQEVSPSFDQLETIARFSSYRWQAKPIATMHASS